MGLTLMSSFLIFAGSMNLMGLFLSEDAKSLEAPEFIFHLAFSLCAIVMGFKELL